MWVPCIHYFIQTLIGRKDLHDSWIRCSYSHRSDHPVFFCLSRQPIHRPPTHPWPTFQRKDCYSRVLSRSLPPLLSVYIRIVLPFVSSGCLELHSKRCVVHHTVLPLLCKRERTPRWIPHQEVAEVQGLDDGRIIDAHGWGFHDDQIPYVGHSHLGAGAESGMPRILG